MNKEQAAQLRQPFDPKHVATLKISGGELQYVGHAEVTDRLLEVDPEWSWEPVAFDDDGLPRFDEHGGLWIRLTVCGVTRYGYGEPQGRKVHDRRKGAISNAIRVAAMRFGVALDLWHKDIPDAEVQVPEEPKPVATDRQVAKWTAAIVAAKDLDALMAVGAEIGGYAMTDDTREGLIASWTARKTEIQ